MDGFTIMFGILWGGIGTAYFIYGKKQQESVPMISGMVLCVFPYFITNPFLNIVVGVVLSALPWIMR